MKLISDLFQEGDLTFIQATLIEEVGVFLKYHPQPKRLENTPLKIFGKNFEKQGKTEKFRLI